MCGIAGIFHLETAKPVDPMRVAVMVNAMEHRGPDGWNVWTAAGVGLGHRRLAIIDLATGDQPMVSGNLTVVFNGEIYNFRELRTELEAGGAVFATQSDTEVILHGWRKWGQACVERFDGMFVFALHDRADQSLFLARDRLGVKPLHYAELSDGAILFASELKGLLAHPLLRRPPDLRAVEDFLGLGYVPDDACIVAGVRKLPAGSHLHLKRGRPLPSPSIWWRPSFADRTNARAGALEEELVDLMRRAVRSRMIADVPLGAFLSGGVDSSVVVALMAEASRDAVETCSIGFDVTDHDETAYARTVARRFATRHRERTVAADDFDLIDRLVAAFDEPFADASAIGTYRVSELAREQVKVALSGDGADEAFAGYCRHAFFAREERVRGMLPASWRRPLFRGLGTLYPKTDWLSGSLRARATLLALARDGGEAYANAVSITPAALRVRLFSDAARRELQGHCAKDRYIAAMKAAPARDPLDRAQYADLTISLPGDVLTKIDRMSMAVGLETREPLLDHRLIEFSARLPASMRLGKRLMKRVMKRYLPDDILHRRKMSVVAPVSAWFRGPLEREAQAIAYAPALSETGWFNMAEITRLADEHRSGLSDHGRLLWQLLMLERSLKRLFGIGGG